MQIHHCLNCVWRLPLWDSFKTKKFATCEEIEKCSEVVSCGGVSAKTLNTPKFGNAGKVQLCISWKTIIMQYYSNATSHSLSCVQLKNSLKVGVTPVLVMNLCASYHGIKTHGQNRCYTHF